MMITRLKTVPWLWVVMTMLPWSFGIFVSCAFGTITTFELRKFTDSPLVIMIILTLPSVLGVTITPIALYTSDHLWTRWGRRKPLLAAGAVPALFVILAIPHAHGLITLTLLLAAYHAANAVGSTFEPLTQEIVPPAQRGRASIVHTLAIQFAVLSFFWLMLGRFDDVYTQWPWSLFGGITGERISFWIMGLMSLSLFLLSALGIKEMPPPQRQNLTAAMGGHFTLWRFLKRFFVDVFKLQFLSIYFLSFAGALYGLGIGGLNSLMYTEQFGYAKQQMGDNVAIGMVVMIPSPS